MDNRAIHDLFSRGSTPPAQQPQPYPGQPQSQIDSLFHNLSAPQDKQQLPPTETYPTSAPETPTMSRSDDPAPSSASASTTTASDRQSALLSLLGGPSSATAATTTSNVRPAATAVASLPQQVPTPPGSSQRSGSSPSHNEAQGKMLLEQLMAG